MFRSSLIAATLIAAAALAGCGGGGSGNSDTTSPLPPVVAPPTSPVDAFGASFALAFRTVLFGEPREPSASDVPPLSLTSDPREPS